MSAGGAEMAMVVLVFDGWSWVEVREDIGKKTDTRGEYRMVHAPHFFKRQIALFEML